MRRAVAWSLGTAVLAVGCEHGTAAARARVEGAVVGPVERVVLWNGGRELEGVPGADGRYAIECGAGEIAGSRVVVEAASGATTTSRKLDAVAPLASAVVVAPLAIWNARVEAKREGDRVRFAWPPREGCRYSLILVYRTLKAGVKGQADATLLTREPEAIQTLADLAEMLPDRDPGAKIVLVRARAYDAADPDGVTWASAALDWTLPDDFPAEGR